MLNRAALSALCALLGATPLLADPSPAYLVKDINTGNQASSPSALLGIGGTLFFAAGQPSTGQEPWRSDGTLEGTYLLKDTVAGSLGTSFSPADLNGTLLF